MPPPLIARRSVHRLTRALAREPARRAAAAWCAVLLFLAAACADGPVAPDGSAPADVPAQAAPAVPTASWVPPSDGELLVDDAPTDITALDCAADAQAGTLGCAEAGSPAAARLVAASRAARAARTRTSGDAAGAVPGAGLAAVGDTVYADRPDTLAQQNTYVRLAGSNPQYVGTTFSIDVTVQNLLNEAIGTPDGVTPAAEGIRVFFSELPSAASDSISILNPDGFLDGGNEPYFEYNEVLTQNEVSSPQEWQFAVPTASTQFTFRVRVATYVQPLLVINEVMVNPPGTPAAEQPLEWFELYNAGTLAVDLKNFVIADSAASGRRPYHLINASVVVPSGGYAVIGGSTNPASNGGAPVDYSYGGAFNLANSLDAVKIARVVEMDTLTIDRVQYSNAAVSAVEAVSRELKNPALDNSNMDGSNWGSASVTSVYGPGGRGTPKAQNSSYVPIVLTEGSGVGPPRGPGRRGGPASLSARAGAPAPTRRP